ncbi:MAG: ABC transporter ATP-binding protein [Candidatus Anoxymicrobium japonicum]|uniref:ABC transporter ATP-binding protein n=1 Tax=Candidatus Anoxymicrobium japonicum TaxID=2013648 RepID=A0A2N3G4L7_9ACTN|nr:MAG: ABC transporter ATP-binding protein [Candidatus Anoxymicrobium japonicum]
MPVEAAAPAIEASGLTKAYNGATVLDIEHLEVARGEILAVLGPSGAGKSVLLRLLNLLEPSTRGTIRFNGVEVQGIDGRKRVEVSRRMAMVFQDPLLFRGSVADNVAYGLKVRGVSPDERYACVNEMLKVVGLERLERARVRALSGGEARRVAFARALVIKPEVLLFDEPFASLDPPTRRLLQEETRVMLKERALSAVFVTHDQEEAARMGDRMLVLNGGSVAQVGSARDIFYKPASEFVARFVGVDNIFSGEVVRCEGGLAQVSVDGSVLEAMTECVSGEQVKLGVRPEDVTVLSASGLETPASSRNAFVGNVTDVEMRGPLARVTLACPFPLVAHVTRRSTEEMGITPGAEFGARFKATAVVVWPRAAVDGEVDGA